MSSKFETDWLQRQLNNMHDTNNKESCRCVVLKPDWKHHQTYCPIWKNGKIAELESFIRDFEDYRPSDGEAMREFQSMAKELLKQQ